MAFLIGKNLSMLGALLAMLCAVAHADLDYEGIYGEAGSYGGDIDVLPTAVRPTDAMPPISVLPPTGAMPPMGDCGSLGQSCCEYDDLETCNTPDLECSFSPFFPGSECVTCGSESELCCFDAFEGDFTCDSEDLICDFSLQDTGPMCMRGGALEPISVDPLVDPPISVDPPVGVLPVVDPPVAIPPVVVPPVVEPPVVDPPTDFEFSGDLTYYGGAGANGACTQTFVPPGFTTFALNGPQYDAVNECGNCVFACWNENTPEDTCVEGIIDNKCPECVFGDLDLGEAGDGRWPLQWSRIPCPSSGPLQFSKQGSNASFAKVKAEGGPTAVAGMTCNGIEGSVTPDGFFEFNDTVNENLDQGMECVVTFTDGSTETGSGV